jgi:hypothetical protein
MKRGGIGKALTFDTHFEQMGFVKEPWVNVNPSLIFGGMEGQTIQQWGRQ